MLTPPRALKEAFVLHNSFAGVVVVGLVRARGARVLLFTACPLCAQHSSLPCASSWGGKRGRCRLAFPCLLVS